MEKQCEYGCGQPARYQMSSGKWCCETSYNKCPAIRAKNAKGLKKAHANGRIKMKGFSDIDRWKSNRQKILQALPKAFRLASGVSNQKLKKYMLEYLGYFYRCEICGISEWQGQPLNLELDHIDGNNVNNELTNLRFLCPNCHSQTITFSGKNKNTGFKKVDDDVIISLMKQGFNNHQILKKLKLSGSGNYRRLNKLRLQLSAELGNFSVESGEFREPLTDLLDADGNPEPS